MQLKKKKWLALLIIALVAILLSNNIDSTTIAQRAIVAGLAIDMDDEEKLEVTAQILVANGSGSSADAKQISAKGETLSGAFTNISKQTSMAISLAHCNLVIMGKKVLEGNAYRVLDYLIRNAYLSENAMLLGSLETGKDILNTKVAFSNLASFYAQRSIFSYGTYQGIAKRSIKNFVTDFNKPCQSNYLPIVEKKKEGLDEGGGSGGGSGGSGGGSGDEGAEPKPSLADDSSGGGSGSSGNSGSGSGGGEEFLFDLTKTGVLRGETLVHVLDEDGTAGLNYVMNEVKRGSITVPSKTGELIELYVIGKSIDKKYDLDTKTVTYDLELSVIYKEEFKEKADKNYKRTVQLSPEEEAAGAELIRKNILDVYEDTRAVGADVYDICEAFHQRFNYKPQNIETFLDSVKVVVNVRFKYN